MHKTLALLFTLTSLTLATACGNGGDATPPADEPGQGAETAAQPDAAEAGADAAAESAPAGFTRSPSPAGARVFFVTPSDGDVVQSPVHLEFGIEGMKVVPAGTQAENGGHHHVIIDTELPPMDAPIPADENHVHFGDGSTETELELAPGEHTLKLLFADHLHVPHDPPVASEPITITVE